MRSFVLRAGGEYLGGGYGEKYKGLGIPTAGGAEEQQKAQEAGQQAGQDALGSFVSGLQEAARLAGEALITGDWASAKEALARAVGDALKGIISSVMPNLGPFGGLVSGFLGGLIDGLVKKFGGKKAEVQKVEVVNAVRVIPDSLNYLIAASPTSRLFGLRAQAGGASFAPGVAVQINFAPGADKVVTAMVTGRLRLANNSGGVH